MGRIKNRAYTGAKNVSSFRADCFFRVFTSSRPDQLPPGCRRMEGSSSGRRRGRVGEWTIDLFPVATFDGFGCEKSELFCVYARVFITIYAICKVIKTYYSPAFTVFFVAH